MNSITPEMVKRLLTSLVTPKYGDLIFDYDVILRQDDEGKTGVGVDVIMDKELYNTFTYYENEDTIERDIETDVRKAMRYLSPHFTLVDFYVIED